MKGRLLVAWLSTSIGTAAAEAPTSEDTPPTVADSPPNAPIAEPAPNAPIAKPAPNAASAVAAPPATPEPVPERPATITELPSQYDDRPPRHLPHHHDGLFLRAALGPGYFRAATRSPDDQRVFSGVSTSLWLGLGGTLSNLVAIGGSYFRDQVWGLEVRDELIDGDEPNLDGYRMAMNTLGFFADFYFGPSSGTHVLALVGVAHLDVDRPGSTDVDDPSGTLIQLGVGHEWWLSDTSLLGGMLSLTYANLTVNETSNDVDLVTLIPQALLTATIN